MTMIADQILSRFDDYWVNSIGHTAVATTPKHVWFSLPIDETTLGGRFGWCWPAEHDDPEHNGFHFLVAYCPEILAEITAHLDDDDRSEYLNGVEWMCSMYLADMESGTDGLADRIRAQLADSFPVTAHIMAEVEARAVNLGIVPTEPGGDVSHDRVCTGCGFVSAPRTNACPLCGTPLG